MDSLNVFFCKVFPGGKVNYRKEVTHLARYTEPDTGRDGVQIILKYSEKGSNPHKLERRDYYLVTDGDWLAYLRICTAGTYAGIEYENAEFAVFLDIVRVDDSPANERVLRRAGRHRELCGGPPCLI